MRGCPVVVFIAPFKDIFLDHTCLDAIRILWGKWRVWGDATCYMLATCFAEITLHATCYMRAGGQKVRGNEMGCPGSSDHTAAGEQGLMMLVQAYWVVMVHVPGGGGVEGQVCGVAYHIPAASTTYNTHSVQTWEGRQVDPGTHSMQHKEQPAWSGGGVCGRGRHPVSKSHYDGG